MLCSLLVCSLAAQAAREPVLKQIQLPHNYYFREIYLPQLTTGPSALAFSPDGKELVYSMGGSLWRQAIGSREARELTHAKGYDYQPDWSPDGRHVVFDRYLDDAVELWQLDLQTGEESALMQNHAVNLEPRYSPDGRSIAFVSTVDSGHFDLYVAGIDGQHLATPRRLVGERQSAISRYYYSPFDHAINPSWTPDGRRLVFVSNREVAYGTGDIWSVAVDAPDDLKKILSEETTWRAQPQVAPDGRRLLFSSYRGRQWQQLWLSTVDGAAPLPLTFGEFDRVQARFSPDGSSIAYVSNEDGNTSLWVQTLIGGARTRIVAAQRRFKNPSGTLNITIHDESGHIVPARVAVLGADDRAYAPDDAWMQADDSFDRKAQAFETHYFHCPGRCAIAVPVGAARLTVTRGMDYSVFERRIEVTTAGATADVALTPLRLPERYGRFASADLHVHMNYGGHYHNTVDHLIEQARAEHLDAIYNLVVNKEQRIPDIGVFGTPARGKDGVLAMQGQEFHTSFWGHLGLLDLDDHFLTPDFSAYRESPMSSPYPDNGAVADLAHAQHGLVGYAHPFDEPVDPDKDAVLSNELPADVAHGKVDYYEVMGFSDHRSTADIWYRLLNLGFRIPAGAGTDAMANYASLRGPVGMNRVFIAMAGPVTQLKLHEGLKQGRTFVSNGPLIGLDVAGKHPGDVLALRAAGKLEYHAALRSLVPVDHFELIYNGRVVATHALDGARTSAEVSGSIEVSESGWLVLRAWNDQADPRVLDIYPYASTSPVYVTVGAKPPRSPADATYFVRWLDRVIEAADKRSDYNNTHEKELTLDYLSSARRIFQARQ
jgi:dipeptidyl aminopeptidase/acylaminoacyl peptidase